ncbi:MAG: glutathione S-transferase N-terminal domain-containing protein [Rubrivivax sp.]
MSTYVLYGNPGWGSAIVEAQLAWYDLPFRVEETGDLFASRAARDALRSLNPVSQVPTLVLPNGQVMTESAAITLHLADLSSPFRKFAHVFFKRPASRAGSAPIDHACVRPVH